MVASKEKPGAAALDSAPDESAPEESDFQLQLAQKLCMLRLPSMSDAGVPGVGEGVVNGEAADIAAIQAELLERGMAKKYEAVCGEFELMVDAEKLESVNTANAAKEKDLDEKITDAEENLGEVEVRDALLAKAVFLRDIGEEDRAEAWQAPPGPTGRSGADWPAPLHRADVREVPCAG